MIAAPPVATPEGYFAYLRRLAAAYPTRCPWLGHEAVSPSFERDRDTWVCSICVREFTPRPD